MQLSTEQLLEPGYGQPDWQGRDKDVLCPLCGYRLLGAVEPRCPECGYSFTWPQILNPALRLHPHLFEHHPERGLSSFLQTAMAGFRPRRFWTSLFPTQPSNPRRLIAYWMIAAVLLVFAAAVGLALNIVGITFAGAGSYVGPATIQKCADISMEQALRDVCTSEAVQGMVVGLVLVPVVWPWLCWVVSLIFQLSMRRARIRPIHLLRMFIYSCDLVFWWGLFILVAALAPVPFVGVTSPQWMVALYQPGGYSYVCSGNRVDEVTGLACLIMLGQVTWRLRCACKYYLQFSFPLGTAIAIQIIAFLFVCTFALLPVWLR